MCSHQLIWSRPPSVLDSLKMYCGRALRVSLGRAPRVALAQVRFLSSLWAHQPVITIDGGLATEIEKKGVNITDPLWSARVLHSNPQMIKDIHLDFLRAGADVILTATYMASVDGLCKHLNIPEQEARDMIKLGVKLAKEACDEYIKENPTSRPLVAGSVGPFGSSYFDGSTFHGNYVDKVTAEEMKDWHRPRFECLLEEGVDFLGVETIPAQAEGEALVDLLGEFPSAKAWVAFTCKNSQQTGHGEEFSDTAASVSKSAQVIAVGLNCLAPQDVEGLLLAAKDVCDKPMIVYPNSGEKWLNLKWTGPRTPQSLASYVPKWIDAGAKAIGGCCRTGPEDVSEIKLAIQNYLSSK